MEDSMEIRILNRIDQMENGIRQELDQKIEGTKEELTQKIEKLDQKIEEIREEFIDNMAVLEHKYGEKLLSLYEFVEIQKVNREKELNRMNDFENRLERNEAKIFNFEQRVIDKEVENMETKNKKKREKING